MSYQTILEPFVEWGKTAFKNLHSIIKINIFYII
jgi:hypothetical protein